MEYLVFIGAIIAVFIILKILSWPIKKILKMIVNIILGGALLILVNYLGLDVPINWITALVVGLLGIPGLIAIVLLQFIL